MVSFESFSEYDSFSMYADWLDDSRSGKTTVLQIDEFWNVRPKSLMVLKSYWEENPVGIALGTGDQFEWQPARDEDTYGGLASSQDAFRAHQQYECERHHGGYYQSSVCDSNELFRKNMTRVDTIRTRRWIAYPIFGTSLSIGRQGTVGELRE